MESNIKDMFKGINEQLNDSFKLVSKDPAIMEVLLYAMSNPKGVRELLKEKYPNKSKEIDSLLDDADFEKSIDNISKSKSLLNQVFNANNNK